MATNPIESTVTPAEASGSQPPATNIDSIPSPYASNLPGKSTSVSVPSRSIRAHFTKDLITVYQAYSSAIAIPAVENQRLTSSPSFSTTRMTWIKPSWSWVCYRSGYSYKDPRQAHILAITMRHEHFEELLQHARIAGEDRAKGEVVVQWDPERSVRIGRLDGLRSIQIGIPGGELVEKWTGEWIVGIEDVTARARELKRVLDEDERLGRGEQGAWELVERGLVPVERCYDGFLSEGVKRRLRMDGFRSREGGDGGRRDDDERRDGRVKSGRGRGRGKSRET